MNKKTKQKQSLTRFGKKVQTSFKNYLTTDKKNQHKKPKKIFNHKSFTKKISDFSKINFQKRKRELSLTEQTFFAKRLSFLLRSGVPVLESLVMIREQTHKKHHAEIIDAVIADVSNGQFLSTSLARTKSLFGSFAINIIRIGETTGILSENLDYLSEELKKKQALRRKIAGAFIYPAIVTLATLGITGFLVVYLFPKIMPVFTSLHVKLPLTTRLIIWISNFLREDGIIFFSAITIFVLGFLTILRKNHKLQFFADGQILKIPIIGTIIQYYNLANANRTLGLLLKSGVTLSEALSITSETSGNLVYKNAYHILMETVNRGEKLSSYLKKERFLFPDVLSQIIAVGERSGDLQNSLIYLAQFYENEVDDFTKNLSNMVEPVLMVCMGILVGFIAISIITPIYGITQNLHS